MSKRQDPEIERLEAELHRSRFEKWEVETWLADRHRAKIEALKRPKNRWGYRWQVFREITDPIAIYVGWVTLLVIATLWALTGEYPLRANSSDVPELRQRQ